MKLTKEIAEPFLECPDDVDFKSFSSIDAAAAKFLSKHAGDLTEGLLCRLKVLSDPAAESLSKCKAGLSLNGLTKISVVAAESLSKVKGCLSLDGLTKISDPIVEILSNRKGSLSLNGITKLSAATAESLSKTTGFLSLDGLTKLSASAAELLAKRKYNGDLHLSSLTELSDSVAASLSGHKGYLFLPESLPTPSDKALVLLHKKKGYINLYPPEEWVQICKASKT